MADTLRPGERLHAGESLVSANGQFELTMQTDGNLVLYRQANRHPMWSTSTEGRDVAFAEMQADGNFVLYDYSHRPVWSTSTEHHPGAWLKIFDVGGFAILQVGVIFAGHMGGMLGFSTQGQSWFPGESPIPTAEVISPFAVHR